MFDSFQGLFMVYDAIIPPVIFYRRNFAIIPPVIFYLFVYLFVYVDDERGGHGTYGYIREAENWTIDLPSRQAWKALGYLGNSLQFYVIFCWDDR